MLIERGAIPNRKEVQVKEGLAEPMTFLAQCDLLTPDLDCDQVECLDLLCTRLLGRGRLGRRTALHPALDHGLFLPSDEDCRDIRYALVFRLAHCDTVTGHAHKPSLPDLPRECAERGWLVRGWYGEFCKHGGDGSVITE